MELNYSLETKLNWFLLDLFYVSILRIGWNNLPPKQIEKLSLFCVVKFKENLEDLTETFNAFYWFDKFKQNIFPLNSQSILQRWSGKLLQKISCKVLKADLLNFLLLLNLCSRKRSSHRGRNFFFLNYLFFVSLSRWKTLKQKIWKKFLESNEFTISLFFIVGREETEVATQSTPLLIVFMLSLKHFNPSVVMQLDNNEDSFTFHPMNRKLFCSSSWRVGM